jgi:hypothetical protein
MAAEIQFVAAIIRLQPRASYLTGFLMLVVAGLALLALWPTIRRVRERLKAERGITLERAGALRRRLGSPALTALLGTALMFALIVLFPNLATSRLPGNQQGYDPQQPIAFSHRLHAGELEISCQYCHSGTERSRHAGIPAAQTCMNCHKFVTAPLGAVRAEGDQAKQEGRAPRRVISPELKKLYDTLGLDAELKPVHTARPLEWVKVQNLADFVYFDHRPHVTSGVSCQTCHGPVETMERVRQFEDLSMGWCVNCHRQANAGGIATARPVKASLDCSSCHY